MLWPKSLHARICKNSSGEVRGFLVLFQIVGKKLDLFCKKNHENKAYPEEIPYEKLWSTHLKLDNGLAMMWSPFSKGQRWVEAFLQTLSLQPLCAAHEAGNLEGWFQCRVQSFGSFWVLHGVVSRWWNRLRWWAPLCSRHSTAELTFRTNHWLLPRFLYLQKW